MATFKERLLEAMALRNMKAIDISEKTGISKARISQYVNGVYTPKSKATYEIAKVLDVSEAWLMGLDVPMKRNLNLRLFDQDPSVSSVPQQKTPPFRLDLFGGTDESENIELLQDINNQVKDNPTNADDEMDTLILEIYKRLPEKKRKEALLTLLDLLKK